MVNVFRYPYINIIWFCMHWLAMSNSCYNPFIYLLLNVSMVINDHGCHDGHDQKMMKCSFIKQNNPTEKILMLSVKSFLQDKFQKELRLKLACCFKQSQ